MEDRVADEGVPLSIATCRSVLGLEHNFQVRGCRLQFELQVRHSRGEKVKRNQRKNRDTETARRGDQRFRDTAGDGLHSEFFVAQKAERLDQTGDRAQQTEQRRERHQRIHDHEEASGAFDLDAGGNLQRALSERAGG
jgi:hypothetical protein